MNLRVTAFSIAAMAMLVPLCNTPAASLMSFQETIQIRDFDYPDAVPGKLASDPANERLFIADVGSNCIHIYDKYQNWEKVNVVILDGAPIDLDFGTSDQLLYFVVSEFDGNHAYFVDPNTPWQIYEMYPDGEPDFVRVVHSANKAIVYSRETENYSRFGPGSQFRETSWGSVPEVNDIDIDETNIEVYAVNSSDGFIKRTEVLTLNSGQANNGEAMDKIAVDPLAEMLYAVNNSSGYIKQYTYNDWFNGTEFYTNNYVDDIDVQESTGLVYYTDSYDDTVYELDPSNGNYNQESFSYGPTDLLVENTANQLFVSCPGDPSYSVDVYLLEGSVGPYPEIKSIGTGWYTLDPTGDISTAYVEVVDDIEVVSVTVNGEPLTSIDGENWSGEFTVPPGPIGYATFEIVATDSDGNETTGQIGFRRCLPMVHRNSNLWETTIGNYWYQRQAMVYGRVTAVNNANSVEIRDGSHPGVIRISAPNHGLSVGQFITARGQLYGHATSPLISTRAAKITVLP